MRHGCTLWEASTLSICHKSFNVNKAAVGFEPTMADLQNVTRVR
jgi:hypothetical protein